jgi:glycerophosphoryl diester phosphodiesterase
MVSSKFKCPQIIGHRGASYYAPENTKAAFELAAKQGAKWVELDVQLTKDKKLAVIHNQTVTKRTNGKGKVIKMDYAEIAKLDAGSWHSEKYVGQRVLSVEKLLKLLIKLDINANIEIKSLPGLNAETTEILTGALKEHWPADKSLPLISSYSTTAIEVIKQLYPALPRALVVGEWNQHLANLTIDLDCVSINADRRLMTQKNLDSMHATGRPVIIHTVNGLKSAIDFIKMGVDGLFTDRPDVIIKALQENNLYRDYSVCML